MPLSVFPKKTFSLIALLAAATLVPAHAESVPVKEIDSADALRETLTAVTDATETEKAKATYDGYTLKITPTELLVPVTPGTVSSDNPTGLLMPLADNITLAGNGSAATTLRTDGAGDFLAIELLKYRFENLSVAGSGTGVDDADGRFAVLSSAAITLGGDTVFTNRFFSANARTIDGACGGIFYSSNVLDVINLDASSGAITFNAITTYGDTLTTTDSAGATTTKESAAAGGVIFLSGTLSVAGGNAVEFSANKAESKAENAWGGALYVTSSAEKPADYGLKFGTGTQVKFTQNAAVGKNAQGGAVMLVNGALSASGSTIEFSGNTVSASAASGASAGGALALGSAATASFDAASTLGFSKNAVTASGEFALAAGGAVYVLDSTLKMESESVNFSENTTTATADGASAVGGALATAGDKTVAEFSVASSGAQVAFSKNRVTASGASKVEDVTNADGSVSQETRHPEALGGAIAISGGKFTFSQAGATLFSENSATVSSAGALAGGGAIAVVGATTEAEFKLGASAQFYQNKALADGAGIARGGAIFQDAGTLKMQGSAAWSFAGNEASASASGTETVQAWGGAIAQTGGTQTYTAINDATLTFSANEASVASEASGSSARGGAIALSGASQRFDGKTVFFGNSAAATHSGTRADNDARTSAAGGAVYTSGTLVLADADFRENTVQTLADGGIADGGALYVVGGSTSASTLNFSANAATAFDLAGTNASGIARGGALYQSSGTFSSKDSTFSGNAAKGEIARGGAAYVGGTYSLDTASGKSSEFENNCAAGTQEASGGAMYVTGALNLSGAGTTTFSGNEAMVSDVDGTALGGAIYASSSLKLSGTGTTTFSGNTANASGTSGTAFGGALYLKGGIHRLDHVTFSGNTATAGALAAGGAIYVDASGKAPTTLTIGGNSLISGNTANGVNSGISIGNGNAGVDAVSQNVTLAIAPGATFSTTTDAAGNTVTKRDSFETVTLADATDVVLKGADFALEKTADGGDFVWSGVTTIAVESVTDAEGKTSGGNFTLGFRSGTTTLQSGFALTGTAANSMQVDAGATLKIESGAAFCNFKSMTLGGTLETSGTLNFADSTVELGANGRLAFADTAASVTGKNTISGALTTLGNVSFTANFVDPATEASLTMTRLNVEKSGEVAFLGGSATQAFVVTASDINFTESATLNLGTGTKLLVKTLNAVHPENSISAAITGTGTLVLLDETSENNTISLNAYYDKETKTFVNSAFSLGSEVTLESGILVNSGTTLTLGNASYKTVVIDGGTLTATSASATTPLKLDTLTVSSSATIGDGVTTQVIELAKTTDDNGNTVDQKISLNGNLEVRENTTLIAGASMLNYSIAGLSGAGTLQGDVSGSGNISIAKIDGNAAFAANQRAAFLAATRVSGSITNAGRLTLGKDAALTASTLSNEAGGNLTFENGAHFNGGLTNAGTLTISGNAAVDAGSTFTQTADGKLVVNSGAMLDFSSIAGTTNALSLSGTLVINPGDFAAGDEFTSLYGLEKGQLSALTITDSAANNLTDRVTWNDALGAYVFLGLNGREIATTLYADFTRENIFRLYDFMRAGLMHASVSTIKPPLFGEKKETSRYMRKYLERKNRFNQDDNKASVPEAVQEDKPGDFGKAANALMSRAWVQTQYSHTTAGSSNANLSYDVNGWGALLGSSLPISETCEIGAVFGYNHSRMKHTGANAHKIDTDAYQLMGFVRNTGESFDGICAFSGAYELSDSERGLNDADFNAWQVGLLLEGGVTFRPESWCEMRPYVALQSVYSRTDSFRESGGEDAFSLEAADAIAARGTFGLGMAFLPFDDVQLSLRAAWNFDIGKSVYNTDAYQASTRSDVVLSSREGEMSSFDLGAYLNFRVNKHVSIYTGYTGTLRSGYEEHRANLGLNVAF